MTIVSRNKHWKWTTWIRLFFAGWRPNRNVWDRAKLPKSIEVFPEAQRVVSLFGGLKFGNYNESVSFDPCSGEEVAQEIKVFEEILHSRLYPVGVMTHQDDHHLLIDENGIVYTLICCPLKDRETILEVEPLASSFERAVDVILSHANRPEREADLKAIGMLGKCWTHNFA